MPYQVTVDLGNGDVPCGTLFTHVRRDVQSASFTYDASYLACGSAFALSPDLPLASGSIHSVGKPLFDAFENCMPDRWGRSLILRAERNAAREEGRAARQLFEKDFLVGVSDVARQGALRIWNDGEPLADSGAGVPREVAIPHLLSQSDLATRDMDADVRDLLHAGSSLGGARPKASVVDGQGRLWIAKFPKAEESALDDVCAWEHVALELARRCGIEAPETRLMRVEGRAVLLVARFDRAGDRRVPYLSGMAAIQGKDGGDYSYLELVDFLEREGTQPTQDIRQLWLRVLLSCAIGNTDDHMRNHGFLRKGDGWRLSPVFDVNPTEGDYPKYLRCAIDLDERLARPDVALRVCDLFRVAPDEARREARAMASTLASWKRIAERDGIAKASMDRMESCFESGIARLRS